MFVLMAAGMIVALRDAGAATRKSGPSKSAAYDTLRVHIGPADRGTDAFVAIPGGEKPAPSMILIHEWWGLNDQIQDVAKRLAAEGYLTIVPDLYHGAVPTDAEKAHELLRGLEDAAALADLGAAAAWIRLQPRAAKTRMGVLGFCMGGSLAESYALADSSLAAVVMFYGHPDTDPVKLAALRAPLQGHFGADDQGIPAAKVSEFKAALERTGKSAEIYVYPGAGHAFMNEARPSYRPDAARQGWARLLAFLQKNVKS
jgi:carboxymethylenebutenolidase